jgi:hypothetical protein
MPLSVISFATYLTRAPWSGDDHNALKFVKAVKGKTFRGWAQVPILGRIKTLEPTNAEDAVDWFGELAAAEIVKLGLRGPQILLPLPNSSSTVRNGEKSRTTLLAGAIAEKLNNAHVWDGLRWAKEMIPTHREGTRDPQELYENLVVTGVPPKGTLILVDDVYTLGGHLKAAVARLAEKKLRCSLAMCAGRTVLESQQHPFLILRQEVEDFTPTK